MFDFVKMEFLDINKMFENIALQYNTICEKCPQLSKGVNEDMSKTVIASTLKILKIVGQHWQLKLLILCYFIWEKKNYLFLEFEKKTLNTIETWLQLKNMQLNRIIIDENYYKEITLFQAEFQNNIKQIDNKRKVISRVCSNLNLSDNSEKLKEGLLQFTSNFSTTEKDLMGNYLNDNNSIKS